MYIHAMVDDSRGWPAMAVRVGVGGMVVWMDGRLNKMFSNKEKENDENEGRIRKRENKNNNNENYNKYMKYRVSNVFIKYTHTSHSSIIFHLMMI